MNDDRSAAARALTVLRTRVDQHFADVQRHHPNAMQCRSGCEQCCHVRLSVFAIEAQRVAAALTQLAEHAPSVRERVRQQADDPAHANRCPMLVDGRCSIYAQRPLICRAHGLPTRIDGRVDVCPLNFRDEGYDETSIIDAEAVNRPLSVMATMWNGDGERIELAELARR